MFLFNLFSDIKERDSSMLTNIDALLVTNGKSVELTYRSSLTSNQRKRGREALLSQMKSQKTAGVYVWRDNNRGALYRGKTMPQSA